MTDTPERIEFSLPKERCMDQAELEERCALHEPSLRLMPDSDWPCWLHLGGPDETVMRQCPVYESTPRCAIHAHSANVRDAAGQTLGTVIVLHDVTRFRELDELKGRFVSTVSHELRTPLSVIMLQVSTLIKYYERLAEPQRRNMIGEIQQQTHLLRELIEDILELSRFDAKRSQPQKRWFDLLGQSQEILDALRPAIQEKRLNLEVSQQLESSYIRADPQQIVRMLRNLMSNAIKYTPEGGHIWLRMDQINGEMRLTVSDTGIGIAPEDRPRIFDRFYRATEATHMSPGTGLGLAIIKEIVDLHDGRIEVDSTVGQGSTFTVYLPVFGES
jgi:two-component system phosphate regulon sensor histidine kinase PhoR